MAFILSRNPAKVRYSEGERRAFAALSSRPEPSTSITGAIYARRERPFNAQKIVVGMLTRLGEKVDRNREPFRVRKSERAGPNPVDFWLERRSK